MNFGRQLMFKLRSVGLKTETSDPAIALGWRHALTALKDQGKLVTHQFPFINYMGVYFSWTFKATRNLLDRGYGQSLLAFQVNLNKMQPHFTLMEAGSLTHTTYSFGSILRLYLLQPKRLRRDTRRGALAISFFAKYYNQRLKKAHTSVVVKGYKKRYLLFLSTALAKFSTLYARTVVFFPQTLTGAFLFRRVKGIKKRIRKRLNKTVK